MRRRSEAAIGGVRQIQLHDNVPQVRVWDRNNKTEFAVGIVGRTRLHDLRGEYDYDGV